MVSNCAYDCRLHLQDLCPYDSDFITSSIDTHHTAEERTEEELCDEERYKDMNTSFDAAILQEEDLKRSTAKGAEFAFSYNDTETAQEQNEEDDNSSDDDLPYTPTFELKVPVGVTAPETVKQNAIIEKTASFVAQEGTQMEILIKARQGRTEKFKFLDWGHPLNTYYKHVLKMIKDYKYIPKVHEPKEKKKTKLVDDYDSDSDSDGHYLHPSLLSSGLITASSTAVVLPAVKYKLGYENDVYSALYKKLSALMPSVKVDEIEEPIVEESGPNFDVPSTSDADSDFSCLPPCASAPELSEMARGPPPSEYNDWHLWFYGVGANSNQQQSVVPPPPDLMPVVNKTAEFVAKFGPAAEDHLRRRPELHLDFLIPNHPYYSYYQMRIRWIQYENYSKQVPMSPYPLTNSSQQMSQVFHSESLSSHSYNQDVLDTSNNQVVKADEWKPRRKRRFFHDGPLPDDVDEPEIEKKSTFVGPVSFAIKEKRADSVPSNMMAFSTSNGDAIGATNEQKSDGNKPVFFLGGSTPSGIGMDEFESNDKEVNLQDEQLQLERKRKARIFLERLQQRLASKRTQQPSDVIDQSDQSNQSQPLPVTVAGKTDATSEVVKESGEISDNSSTSSSVSSSKEKHKRRKRKSSPRQLPSAYAYTRNRSRRSRSRDRRDKHSRSRRSRRSRSRS